MQVFATGKTSALGRALHQLNCFFPKHRQAVRIMKLTTILLLAACLQLSARGISQTISISVKDAPLLSVLKAIEKQTDFVFIVDNQWLQKSKKVTITANNLPLQKVLELCFKDQPLTYNISGKVIVISPKEVKAKDISLVNEQQVIDVKGRVVNENGEPVQASVTVKGTKEGTTTNANGEFRLQNVDENAVLVISGVGIEERELKVAGKTNLYAVVKIAVKPLDEVQMIAYGTTTKRLNTGNVSSVKASDIEKQPVNNPLLALEGRVPGLVVNQNTGISGGGITIRIQGQNSLNRGSDPLYIIDGVPYISQLLPNYSGTTGILGDNGNTNLPYGQGGGGNPLAFINPADIESIEILKDADATAIYGSRAGNGAVIITTKKGKVGPVKTDINVQSGFGKVTRFLPLLNTQQYLEMRHEAKTNDGAPVLSTDYDINGTWDTTRNTDWQKELLGGAAHYTDAQASISGGNVNTTFLVGTGYHRETTVFPGDLSDQKGSVHLNLNNTSPNQLFKLQIDAKYLVDNNKLITTDLTRRTILMAPDAPPLYNADGSLNWEPLSNGNSSWVNPLNYLLRKYDAKTNNLISNAILSYRILSGLEIKSSFGYTNLQRNEIALTPSISYAPESRITSTRVSNFGKGNINSWIIEPQATYKMQISKGRLEALVGSTILQLNSDQQRFDASGFSSDAVMEDIRAASSISIPSVGGSVSSVYRYNAIFSRLTYNWQNKYIVNLAARRDGSSRFGSENEFHNFGSVAGAWIFSEERFFKKQVSLLSFGKIRGSYGSTGNDQIGDYQFMNLYSPYSVPTAYQGIAALTPQNLPNSHLQWEETKKLQFGLDLGFIKDRIILNVNYYRNRSSNLLQEYALPIITGFTSIQTNFPALVENTGWEFSVNTTNIIKKDFNWTSFLNFTIAKNTLESYTDLETSSSKYTYVVGQPVTIQKRLPYLGVDPSSGLYIFADAHGNAGSSTFTLDDRTALININPKFYGGLQNNITYKGFALDFLFQFVKQIKPNYFLGNFPGEFDNNTSIYSAQGNQPTWVLDRWQKPGDLATHQKFSTFYPSKIYLPYNDATVSSAVLSDASFIRLKNVSFSWSLPEKIKRNIKLKNARIYVQGQNLKTITHFMGMDPENANINTLPPLRVITLGIQIGL
jgi:TonB-linked SusC/RagA family outer membrane protein